MSQAQDDHISISSSKSSTSNDDSSPESVEHDRKSENDGDDQSEGSQNEQTYGMQIRNTGSTTNNVTMNSPMNPNVGDSNNYYAPVTIYVGTDKSNAKEILIDESFLKSANSKNTFQHEPEIIIEPHLEEIVVLGREPPDTNITTDSGLPSHTVEIAKITQPSTPIETSDLQKQSESDGPKLTLSVPHEQLTHTFDFILSKRFKCLMIIVLTGTTIFIGSMIVLGYFLNKNFYDDIKPGPCGLVPCPPSTVLPPINFI